MGTGQIKGIKNQEVIKAQGIGYPLPKRLYSLPEASIYLGRSLWSTRELVWAGKLPIVRDGKRIFVDIVDLENYVTRNKTTYI
jgi:hypothetical protein